MFLTVWLGLFAVSVVYITAWESTRRERGDEPSAIVKDIVISLAINALIAWLITVLFR